MRQKIRRVTTVMATVCLLGAGAAPTLAQEPSPDLDGPPQRIEIPDYGLAATPPEGWSAEWVERRGVPPRTGLVLTALGPEQHCLASSGSLDGVPFDDLAGWFRDNAFREENTSHVDSPIAVHLPAGPGVLFDVEQGPEPLSPAAQYLIDGGDRFLSINCIGHVRPDDDWRSIAEVFEFIAQRYEHVGAGVAITWPPGPEVSEYDDTAEWGGLIFGTIGDDTVCQLVDEALFRIGGQDGRSLDALVEAWRDAQPFGEPVDAGGLHPSVERAVRLDSADRSMYLLVAGETIISLSCQAFPPSPEPPEDRWLSIAETFEFLPGEE